MPIEQRALRRSLAEEVAAAMTAVRAAPQSLEPRMALFQLDCVTGNWERARRQLGTMAALDSEAAMLAVLGERLIRSEEEREQVFAGQSSPIVVGPPRPWIAMLARALAHDAAGEREAALRLRSGARDEAPARPGTMDGISFSWIMDADLRLGPVLEVVVDGNYRWLPFEHIRWLRAGPPTDLMDLIWQPVDLCLANDADLKAFVPVRYPGSAHHADDAVRLARVSLWLGEETEQQIGYGQRLLATDRDDYPFLDLRRLEFAPVPVPAAAHG
jgi:type VI secretion system protein ImpE